MVFERQAAIVRQAEANRQNACASGVSEQCKTAARAWPSEMNLYEQLQQAYQSCLQQRRVSSQAIPNELWFAPQFRLQY